MHDAVTVVWSSKRELKRVPGVINPLVRQDIEIVHSATAQKEKSIRKISVCSPDIVISVGSGVSVK